MLAIIGGTGLSRLEGFEDAHKQSIETPYSDTAVEVKLCSFNGNELLFLPRHGADHVIPPHRINYRANIWALQKAAATKIVAVNAVGGIHTELGPGNFAVPDQIIDYTWGRSPSFFENDLDEVTHIDFTHPYTESLRQQLISTVQKVNESIKTTESAESERACLGSGVYGTTQGPRLETAAEIRRFSADGCDMVGMTGMPEAALARELNLEYASLAFSVNWAAGLSEELISLDEIHLVLSDGMGFVTRVLQELAVAH